MKPDLEGFASGWGQPKLLKRGYSGCRCGPFARHNAKSRELFRPRSSSSNEHLVRTGSTLDTSTLASSPFFPSFFHLPHFVVIAPITGYRRLEGFSKIQPHKDIPTLEQFFVVSYTAHRNSHPVCFLPTPTIQCPGGWSV